MERDIRLSWRIYFLTTCLFRFACSCLCFMLFLASPPFLIKRRLLLRAHNIVDIKYFTINIHHLFSVTLPRWLFSTLFWTAIFGHTLTSRWHRVRGSWANWMVTFWQIVLLVCCNRSPNCSLSWTLCELDLIFALSLLF